jgi:drug/metabolite transporter (DMT)-like permease
MFSNYCAILLNFLSVLSILSTLSVISVLSVLSLCLLSAHPSSLVHSLLVPAVLIGEVVTRQDCVGGSLIILGCLTNEIDVFAYASKAKQILSQKTQQAAVSAQK